MSGGLRALGRDQARQLEEFRSSEEAGLLSRLAQAECLLGLAKLSSQRVDLASYAGLVVGVITQFVPARACRVTLEVPDVPPIAITYGTVDDADRGDDEAHRRMLSINGVAAGELHLVPEIDDLSPPAFIQTLADQVSASLGALVETERLRRQAALAQAMRLAEGLSDEVGPNDLSQLVEALAALPNAIGARLEIVHPSVGGPVSFTAGAPPFSAGEITPVAGGSFAVNVRWATAVQPRDRKSLEDLITILSGALAKADERRRLLDEAETDPLTGIGNRRRATRALSSAIALAHRNEDCVGVLYLDLDNFKRVNDSCGHEVGDLVLVRFAQHLEGMVRVYDTVTRYGGEEFLIICPGLDQTAGASLARRILDATPTACADALPAGWDQTASVGLACYPDAADYPDGVLRAADRALYAAKNGGRNQVRLASEVDRPTRSA